MITHDILCADVGGTNARFAHFTIDTAEGLQRRSSLWLETAGMHSLEDMLRALDARGFPLRPDQCDYAAIAVAGPVSRGVRSYLPLAEITMDMTTAAEEFSIADGGLINDFVAQAYACHSPLGQRAQRIIEGIAVQDGTVAVIGAGTGMGKSALIPDGSGGFVALPSEGGHSDFPFLGEHETAYRDFLICEAGVDEPTPNNVVSGRGLSNLYWFLRGERLEPQEVSARITEHDETTRWFARFYGRVARNFALETLATGGMFIAGGLAARNPMLVTNESFKAEFHRSETHAKMLQSMPVALITDEESGLWGAAYYAQIQLLKGSE